MLRPRRRRSRRMLGRQELAGRAAQLDTVGDQTRCRRWPPTAAATTSVRRVDGARLSAARRSDRMPGRSGRRCRPGRRRADRVPTTAGRPLVGRPSRRRPARRAGAPAARSSRRRSPRPAAATRTGTPRARPRTTSRRRRRCRWSAAGGRRTASSSAATARGQLGAADPPPRRAALLVDGDQPQQSGTTASRLRAAGGGRPRPGRRRPAGSARPAPRPAARTGTSAAAHRARRRRPAGPGCRPAAAAPRRRRCRRPAARPDPSSTSMPASRAGPSITARQRLPAQRPQRRTSRVRQPARPVPGSSSSWSRNSGRSVATTCTGPGQRRAPAGRANRARSADGVWVSSSSNWSTTISSRVRRGPGAASSRSSASVGQPAAVEPSAHLRRPTSPARRSRGGGGQLPGQRRHRLGPRQDRRHRPPPRLVGHHRQQPGPHQRRLTAPRRAHHQQHRGVGALGRRAQQRRQMPVHLGATAEEHPMLVGVERAQPRKRRTGHPATPTHRRRPPAATPPPAALAQPHRSVVAVHPLHRGQQRMVHPGLDQHRKQPAAPATARSPPRPYTTTDPTYAAVSRQTTASAHRSRSCSRCSHSSPTTMPSSRILVQEHLVAVVDQPTAAPHRPARRPRRNG